MPALGGAPQRKKFGTSSAKAGGEAPEEEKAKPRSPAPGATKRPPPKLATKPIHTTLLDDDDDDDDDDEIIQASLDASKNKKLDPKLFALIGTGAAVLVVVLFLLLGGKKDPGPVTPPVADTPPVEDTKPPEQQWGDGSLGIQDFTQNTTMDNTSPLTDPNGFVEDLHGLTTRVDYTVSAIQSNVVDFVNYTKKRGTWGGGLELYYLDCTYKGNQYVVQVPFLYYKELDDEGIVPVKMEVLFVKEANGDTLSIVSYMQLDAATLQAVIKSKK